MIFTGLSDKSVDPDHFPDIFRLKDNYPMTEDVIVRHTLVEGKASVLFEAKKKIHSQPLPKHQKQKVQEFKREVV